MKTIMILIICAAFGLYVVHPIHNTLHKVEQRLAEVTK